MSLPDRHQDVDVVRGVRSRRLVIGMVFVGVSVLNLVANASWLRTGDVYRPTYRAVMLGGWTGFWITTVLFSALLVVGVVLLALEWRDRTRADARASDR